MCRSLLATLAIGSWVSMFTLSSPTRAQNDEEIEIPDIDIDIDALDAELATTEATPVEPAAADDDPPAQVWGEDNVADPVFPTDVSAPPVAEPPDSRGGFTSYVEGLTYAPSLSPLPNFQVLPTSQSMFDSYVPFFGDEGGAGGLWVGYQGTGIAGLATMGLSLAGNRLIGFPSDKDLGGPLAAGGFNDRAPLSIGQGLLGVYGRLGAFSVAVGGTGALESVPAYVSAAAADLAPFELGYGYGGATEVGLALSNDSHIFARAALTQVQALSGGAAQTKLDPLAGVMISVFGAPLVVGLGASVVIADGRDPIVAPRIFLGGGTDFGTEPASAPLPMTNDESPSAPASSPSSDPTSDASP